MFHVQRNGETTPAPTHETVRDFELGVLIGLLVGEGHFGGDGRVPQVTLRMHTRHERMFRWLVERWGGRLYGPYTHAGRSYYQWMARGDYLRDTLLPILERGMSPDLDGPSWERYTAMRERYRL
jgi:hypothetical protein